MNKLDEIVVALNDECIEEYLAKRESAGMDNIIKAESDALLNLPIFRVLNAEYKEAVFRFALNKIIKEKL